VILASLPSPTQSVWHLGPVPVRAYALCIIVGIIAAIALTERRLRARGGPAGAVTDIAVWAVPFGIIGARIYHVLTPPTPYFGAGGHPLDVFKIYNGGLGIWGAIAGGAIGAWIGCRQKRIPLSVFADAAAPGLVLAQAIGRFGNWFNNELYGRHTGLPWGLEIHTMDPVTGHAIGRQPGLYHPTFLYESLWCLGVFFLLLWADRRFQLGSGRLFALYVMAYVVGRAWIESLRIDAATHFFAGRLGFLGSYFDNGIRLNDLTSLVVFIGALIFFRRRRGQALRVVPPPADSPSAEDARAVDPAEEHPGIAASATEGDEDPADVRAPAGDAANGADANKPAG
jgi:prolipoprotein diacylglyceryl transferase